MPVLLVWPTTVADAAQHATTAYRCPVYVNSQRANVYSPMVATFTLEVGPPGGGAEGASDTAVVRASARAATLCSIGKANIERTLRVSSEMHCHGKKGGFCAGRR